MQGNKINLLNTQKKLWIVYIHAIIASEFWLSSSGVEDSVGTADT